MSSGSSNHQTLTFLKQRFAEAGIRPQGKLGQNFLIDLNLIRLLADSARLGPHDVVLEVGTGTGSLTQLMARQAARVVTVELDPVMFNLAGEALHTHPNVRQLHADILKNKNRLSPEVLAVLEEELSATPGSRFKLAANLPYNVATPIITNLLALDVPPRSMTVTIQKEVGDRLVARPGTKDYGSLAIWVQSQCRVEMVRVMPPTVFWPRPKVDSAIVHIELDDARRARIADRKFFHEFVRAMFFHRRKFLRSELLAAFKKQVTKPLVDQIMADLGLDPQIRAEVLDVETMLALCDAMRARVDASDG